MNNLEEFRRGRGYVDQTSVVRQVCKKYLMKSTDVLWGFMDFEKSMTELIGKGYELY